MDEQLRLEVRNEIQMVLEEKRLKEEQEWLIEEEKNLKSLSYSLVFGCTLMALLFSQIGTDSALTYLLCFAINMVVPSIICFFIIKSKVSNRTKSLLMMIPAILYTFAVIQPLVLFEFGII